MFDWKVQKLDFQIHINIPQPKVLHILDASNIIIGLKINNIVANIIRIHSFVLITLRGFFKSDYVQPQTHNTLNANFRVSGNVKRAVRDTQTDRWGGGGGAVGVVIPQKMKIRGACAYLSLSERGRGWVGVGAYSRLGTY